MVRRLWDLGASGVGFKVWVLTSGVLVVRASENFWGCLAQYPLKNLGQILAALAISGIFERFSPGQIRSEVGRPGGLFKAIGLRALTLRLGH